MIDSIARLGQLYLKEERKAIFNIEEKGIDKYKEPKIIKLILDLDKSKIETEPIKATKEYIKDYLWIGEVVGSYPQIKLVLTSKKLGEWEGLKKTFDNIKEKIEELKLNKDEEIKKLYDCLVKLTKSFNEDIFRKAEDDIKKYNEVFLYTISLRENDKETELAKTEGYIKFLEHIILYGLEAETKKFRCYVCGEFREVLVDPAFPGGSILKIYNVDRKNFLSNVSNYEENLLRTFAICLDCKKNLVAGWNYIQKFFNTRIGDLTVYLIPSIYGGDESELKLDEIKNFFNEVFGIVKSYVSIENVEKFFKDYYEFRIVRFLNIIFGKRELQRFKCYYYIQDVPVMRFVELGKYFCDQNEKMYNIFNKDDNFKLSLEYIYEIYPVRVPKRRDESIHEMKSIMDLYNSLFKKLPFSRNELYRRALLLTKIYMYETGEVYNIKKIVSEKEFCEKFISYNILIKVLYEGESIMSDDFMKELEFDKDLYEYYKFFQEYNYNGSNAALFLLGVLIGKIGSEQYKKGDEKKAVLNKINVEGMSAERILMLSNYIIEGLRNYRILNYENEKIYGIAKKLLDRYISTLQNPNENVFYLLSGYAYITLKIITSGE